jgi:hypothetical protein
MRETTPEAISVQKPMQQTYSLRLLSSPSNSLSKTKSIAHYSDRIFRL